MKNKFPQDVNTIVSQYFDHANNKENYYKKFDEFMESYINDVKLAYITEWNNKFYYNRVVDFLLDKLVIKYSIEQIGDDDVITLYFKDPVTHVIKPLTISALNDFVIKILDQKDNNHDLSKTSISIIDRIKANKSRLGKLKTLPSHYIPHTNGFYDFKKGKFYEPDSSKVVSLFEEYDMVIEPMLKFHENIDTNCIEYKVWDKFIDDLSDSKADKRLLFEQLVCAVIEGFGRQKYIMMSGTPGSGKSTFMRILEHLAGPQYTVYHTMDKFADHNSLNRIKLNTKLICGDDLQKSAKLNGEGLRNYKTLVDGNAISVSVKYQPNMLVKSHGVWLQMMNDAPSIYESNDAIKGRSVFIHITGKNHRDTKDVEERSFGKLLDDYTGKLTGKPSLEFLSIVSSVCLQKTEYFDQFTISQDMIDDTNAMVDEGSWAKSVVDWLEMTGVLHFSKLPGDDLYKLLDSWMRSYNPSMAKPSYKKFNQEIKPYLIAKGYMYNQEFLHVSNDPFVYNRSLVSEFTDTPVTMLNKRRCSMWQKPNTEPSKDELDKKRAELYALKDSGASFDTLDPEQRIMAEYCIKQFDVDVIDWKNS